MQAWFIYGPYLLLVILAAVDIVRRRVRGWWMLWLLFCFSKFLAFDRLGGSAFCPNLPEKLIWFWDWAYSGAIIMCALFVLASPFRFRRKTAFIAVAAWALSLWGLWNGLHAPAVHAVDIAFPDLPASLDGYRIVQLADLHASHAARRWRTQAVVDSVNALEPDLICLTGDNADGHYDESHEFLEPIRALSAKDGVFGCTGNHEYYFRHPVWKRRFYGKLDNLRLLENECVFPRRGLALAGVPDLAPSPAKAFAAATNGEFRVLLQHRPKTAPANAREAGVRLQLSGHTHGGIAPVFRPLVGRFNGGFTRGLYRLTDGAVLYVSPGCGQWGGFPMRFFNASEITLITLHTASSR